MDLTHPAGVGGQGGLKVFQAGVGERGFLEGRERRARLVLAPLKEGRREGERQTW